MPNLVSTDDFATYLNNPSIFLDPRAEYILTLAQTLCESVVSPLPAGAEIVVLDVAERAYANPTSEGGAELGLYSEGVGPYSTSSPGTSGGGLYLTAGNRQTLENLAGRSGGAFTIDTLPATAGQNLPPWDVDGSGGWGGWDQIP